MSQVWRRSEVGKHKQRSLNTRLSSGTSAGTFACPRGLTANAEAKQVRKTNRTDILYQIGKKWSENRSSRFEPKNLLISCSRGSGPPLRVDLNPSKTKSIVKSYVRNVRIDFRAIFPIWYKISVRFVFRTSPQHFL